MAQGWLDRIGNMLKLRNQRCSNSWEPTAEIEYTDEGDWSLSLESGSNIYMIHPMDSTYTKFAVLRQTCTELETLCRGVTLEEALGRCA